MELRDFLMPEKSSVGHAVLDDPGWASFLARFILTRPYQSHQESTTHFPDLIHRVVDEIIENVDHNGDSGRIRAYYITKLCTFIQGDTWNNALDTRTNDELFERVLFIAAIYLNAKPLVDRLIGRPHRQFVHNILCSPLHAAMHVGNPKLMRQLIQHGHRSICIGHRVEGRSLLEQAVSRSDVADIMAVLSEPGDEFRSIWKGCDSKDCWVATCLAIDLDRFEVASKLLDLDQSIWSSNVVRRSRGRNQGVWIRWNHPNWIGLQNLIFKAIFGASKKRQLALVYKILNVQKFFGTTNFTSYKCVNLWLRACEEGAEPVLRILLKQGLLIKTKASWVDAFIEASIAGRTLIGSKLLDLRVVPGTTLDDDPALKLLQDAAPCHESVEIIRYLCQERVIIIDRLYQYQGLVDCIGSAAKYGNHKFLELLASYGFPLGERSLFTSFNCPPPIITAKAFHQKDTVRELLRLGVPDADPLDSILAHQFASGEYPTDPPAHQPDHDYHIEEMMKGFETQKNYSWDPYHSYSPPKDDFPWHFYC